MRNFYLDPKTDEYKMVELKDAASFKRAIEDLQKNEVVLAHGFCTVCKAVTYYVRDYNIDGLSHICSECGVRYQFKFGDERYIEMEKVASSDLPKNIKNEIQRLNSIPVQKKLVKETLAQFVVNKLVEKIKFEEDIARLRLLQNALT